MASRNQSAGTIEIEGLKIERMLVEVEGESPLIMHRWSDKAKRMMWDKQQKAAPKGKEIRNPQQEVEDALYRDEAGHPAMPSTAFKSAIVEACAQFGRTITKKLVSQSVHVDGEYVRIFGDYEPREDMVRVGMGVADIRFRPQFSQWRAVIPISYNSVAISKEQIIKLLEAAGFGVGVGDYRPERGGQFGRFRIVCISKIDHAPGTPADEEAER